MGSAPQLGLVPQDLADACRPLTIGVHTHTFQPVHIEQESECAVVIASVRVLSSVSVDPAVTHPFSSTEQDRQVGIGTRTVRFESEVFVKLSQRSRAYKSARHNFITLPIIVHNPA